MDRFSSPPARSGRSAARSSPPAAPQQTFTELERLIMGSDVVNLGKLLLLDSSEALLVGNEGMPPLNFAVAHAQAETRAQIVRVLVGNGAPIDDTDIHGKTVLEIALARDVYPLTNGSFDIRATRRSAVDLCLLLLNLGAPAPKPFSLVGRGNDASARCLREHCDAVTASSLRHARRHTPDFWVLVAEFLF